ncbi:MAG: GNAT family N-acetyltransferase [Fimbriimonas sp.]
MRDPCLAPAVFFGLPFGNQIESIRLGHTPGHFWESEGGIYVWDERYSHYVVVTEPIEGLSSSLASLIDAEVLPEARKGGIDLGLVYLQGEIRCPLSGESRRKGRASTLRAVSIPDGLGEVRPITAAAIGKFQEIREEVVGMWGSEMAFLRGGFGFYVRLDNRCAAWCTAEYLTRDACAAGVATDPNLRGQGFATRAGAAMVNHAVGKALRVYWDAWERNEASLALERRLGFGDRREYEVFLCRYAEGL